jgi:hypothetical protein
MYSTRIWYADKTANAFHCITHIASDRFIFTKDEAISRILAGERFYVGDGAVNAQIEVHHDLVHGRYLRTKPDASTRNNLLSLPAAPPGLVDATTARLSSRLMSGLTHEASGSLGDTLGAVFEAPSVASLAGGYVYGGLTGGKK